MLMVFIEVWWVGVDVSSLGNKNLGTKLCRTVPGKWMSCRLLTAKSRSSREVSCQPAFMSTCLTISQTCLPCPPSRWIVFSVDHNAPPPYDWASNDSSIDVFWDGEYGFSTLGVVAILGNGCGIQGQNYVALLQGSETTGFHHRSWILCIKRYRTAIWYGSQCYASICNTFCPNL